MGHQKTVQTVAIITTVFFSWTFAYSQQTQMELGKAIFEIIKFKNISAVDSHILTVDEWTSRAKSHNILEKDINQNRDTFINWRKGVMERFNDIINDGENIGVNWTEIIIDSIQVSEFEFSDEHCLDCPVQKKRKDSFITINFSFKKRRFNIDIRFLQYNDRWKILSDPDEILFNELIIISKKIGD